MLTPSSNTVLEPLTQAMLADLEEVTAHFSRFRVTEISLKDAALGQFDYQQILAAADLLVDAKVDVIAWSGTSSGWLGFERDEELCRQIESATGVPASTSVLALNEIFARANVKKIGLVTPYLDEIQDRIIDNYRSSGITCVSSENLRDKGNFSFSEVSEDTITKMVRSAALAKPDAIAIFCTNLRGAGIVQSMEQELGIPIYDSVSTAVWKSLRIAGVDTKRLKAWGSLFSDVT